MAVLCFARRNVLCRAVPYPLSVIGLAWCGQCVSRHRAALFTFHFSLFTLITQCGALALAARSDGTCSVLRRASQRTAFLQGLLCVILCAVLLGACQCSVRHFSLGRKVCLLPIACSRHGGGMAFATQLHGSLTTFVATMRRRQLRLRYRLTAWVMLVAVLAMLVHTAVPHHHHTHFVALVCLHHHAGEAHLAAPVCPGSGEGCQAEDSADCQPCGQQGQAALRPAVRQWHGSMPACHRLVPPLDFLPALQCLCPGPLMAVNGRCKPGDVWPVPALGAFHGLCSGRRAPPCGC